MKTTIIPVIAVVFVIGVIFSIKIGTSDYEQVGLYGAIAASIYFLVHGWRNVWWIAAFLIFAGAVFMHGFHFTSSHLFVMMLVIASVMSFLNRRSTLHPPEFRVAGERGTAVILGLTGLFGLVHFFVNYAIPYSPHDYSIKTSTKVYFDCYATVFCFLWLMKGPYGFILKSTWPQVLLWIIFVTLTANVVVRGYMFLQGFQAVDGLTTTEEGVGLFSLHVPVINMVAGVYTLRTIGPMSFVIFLMFATSTTWWREQTVGMKAMILGGLGMSLIGSVFGGGRASIPLCLVFACGVAVLRRKIIFVFVMGMGAALAVILINLFGNLINTHAPTYIARSLQLVMIEKGETFQGISGSQDVRDAARDEAIVQWRKDNRVFLFGRSVFSITWEEALYSKNRFGVSGFVDNAMRSGATHNLVTDLLLQYGLIGCTLYLASYLAIIRFVLRLYRRLPPDQVECIALAGAMVIYLPFQFLADALGGGFIPIVAALVVGLIRVQLVSIQQTASVPAPVPSGPHDQGYMVGGQQGLPSA